MLSKTQLTERDLAMLAITVKAAESCGEIGRGLLIDCCAGQASDALAAIDRSLVLSLPRLFGRDLVARDTFSRLRNMNLIAMRGNGRCSVTEAGRVALTPSANPPVAIYQVAGDQLTLLRVVDQLQNERRRGPQKHEVIAAAKRGIAGLSAIRLGAEPAFDVLRAMEWLRHAANGYCSLLPHGQVLSRSPEDSPIPIGAPESEASIPPFQSRTETDGEGLSELILCL